MATSFAATTPTRSRSPARIHTPPTPRLGGYSDNWEPYSPPRKSARISSRVTDNRTPSPNSSGRISRPRHQANTSAARTNGPSPDNMTSPPATLSPQKKRQPTSASATVSRSISGSLTAQNIRDAATALKMDSASASRAALALPTPAKTPARLNPEQTDKEVTAIARKLFGGKAQVQEEDAPMTVKKTRTKRNTGISLGSFQIHDNEAPIEIFTDSENRLPKADATAENPFYGDAGIAASAAPIRRSTRHKKNAALEKELVEQKLNREDGLLYVFRGKKVFKKFADPEAATRSYVAPRLLFPGARKSTKGAGIFDDEEAETDIEEQINTAAADAKWELENPVETSDEETKAPKAPKHAPVSPPSTSRATRSKKHIIEDVTPVKSKGKRVVSGGRSPFDGWRRTKNSPSSSTSRKRSGDSLAAQVPKRSKA